MTSKLVIKQYKRRSMNKEKILEKSRNENLLGDERKKEITKKSFVTGVVFASLMFIIMITLSWFKEFDTKGIRLMMASMLIGILGYQFIKKAKYSHIISNILNLLILVSLIIALIMATLEIIK